MELSDHAWSSGFEHDGMGWKVFTRCLTHPRSNILQTYDWPTNDEMTKFANEHEEETREDAQEGQG